MPSVNVRDTFEALEPLDLKQCQTVGELVRAMEKCSFVARMIGEVAETLRRWFLNCYRGGELVDYIHMILPPSFCGKYLGVFGRHPFLPYRGDPEEINRVGQMIIIGRFGEKDEVAVSHRSPENTIFINREGLCIPGQVQDGYFPNVVFEDPRFVLPVISAALDEWLGIKTWTVTELFKTLAPYGGIAAEVVEGARVLKAMIDDPDCTVFMTASGAMSVAQMDYLFCDMIEDKMIQYLATTGALMAHGLVKSTGCRQFKHRPEHGDALYAEQKINRVTDTLEPEENFSHINEVLNLVLDSFDSCQPISPNILHRAIGRHLVDNFGTSRGILKSAFQHNVPVCVPAFVDSEIGNDVFCHNAIRAIRERGRRPKIIMDLELDSKMLMNLALSSKKMGLFSIGGGVPRNNTQNVAPLIEIYRDRLGDDLSDRYFTYGCRICPDPMWHGHLSSCTYSENESWRKMKDVRTSGNFAEVHADATATWPFILKWVMENR
ncbi:MAG: deoxyhypusine synthase family protein [Candidatus Vogelbacteria bacterium]|nr:deoxyhypusine synthase family protein [Candidatus Vogelbacteria bacterium]